MNQSHGRPSNLLGEIYCKIHVDDLVFKSPKESQTDLSNGLRASLTLHEGFQVETRSVFFFNKLHIFENRISLRFLLFSKFFDLTSPVAKERTGNFSNRHNLQSKGKMVGF